MSKNKDWWDFPWNPVKGCGQNPHCPYCYGCKIVKRFGYAEKVAMKELSHIYDCPPWPCEKDYDHLVDRIKSFQPTFFEYVLAQKLRKKPTIYFFSMSDPASWEQEWYEKIVAKIAHYMQHTFVVLTKHPEIYRKYTFPHNTMLGVTITCENDVKKFWDNKIHYLLDDVPNKTFLSVEPLQESLEIGTSGFWGFVKYFFEVVDLVIVGPETGNRKGKDICKPEWLDPFFDLDILVYMKNACAKITDRKLRQEWVK